MDVTIQINDPVLMTTEYFLVRYRLLPAGVWVDLGAQTNASFQILGLADGEYELEVRFVNEEGVICPAVTREFTVSEDPPPDECLCPDLTELYITRKCDDTSVIHMTFSGVGNGVCQFNVQYTQWGGGGQQTLTYTPNNIPAFLDLIIPTTGNSIAPTVTTWVDCCDGATNICNSGQITDIRNQDCDCVSPYISGAWINYDPTTDEYLLCINFTSSNVAHTIYAKQQQTVNPAVFNEVTTPTVADGYFEIPLDPEPFNNIEYYVLVSNSCGSDYRIISIAQCGINVEYQGGQVYPTTMTIQINPTLSQSIYIEPASVPDKFIVLIGGVEVVNTGYIGNASYQPQLDAALTALGDPTEVITPMMGGTNFAFANPTFASFIQLKVYAPLENTSWNIVAGCAEDDEGNLITLIVENTTASNVLTHQVHGIFAIPGSTITFSPMQPQNNTQTFYNVPGWIGSPSCGVYLDPIVAQGRNYKVEVLQNGTLITTNTFAYGGGSMFHLPASPTGIVDGDTIRIRISSTVL